MTLSDFLARWEGAAETIPEPLQQPSAVIPGGDAHPHLCMKPAELASWDEIDRGNWEAELKLDGYRCLHIDGRMVTAEGVPFDAATHVLPWIRKMEEIAGRPLFLDGEYVEEAGYDATAAAFQAGRGSGTFWIHDLVPLEAWQTGNPITMPRHRRRAAAEILISQVRSPFIGFIKSVPIAPSNAQRIAQSVIELGAEGLVLKRHDGVYMRGSGMGDWLKVKNEATIDVRVLDVLLDRETYRHKALLCRGPNGETFKVTSGLSGPILAALHAQVSRNSFPMVEISLNKRVGAKNGGHPRFVRVRFDKGLA